MYRSSLPPAVAELCFVRSMTRILIAAFFERAGSVTARSSGRTVTLSPREVAGLDKLFQFYSSRPRGGCTTQDDIGISQFRSCQKISSEHYVDGSCASYQMKDITRFYEIAKKLGLEHDT